MVTGVRITRTGLTPLKGGRHQALPWVDLEPDGPVGDRAFCLVDRERGRVVRTVGAPALVATTTTWSAGVLTSTLPDRTVEGVPGSTGETVKVDYWGRTVALDVVAGPWAAAFSTYLGTEVVLARATAPGDVVYAGPVSLVTTSSIALLAERSGRPVDPVAFRSTFVVDTDDLPAHVEDGWAGGTLRLGDAVVEVRSALPRCAVVDLDPETGERAHPLLATLAGYRRRGGEVLFGVDAVVRVPGRVSAGDLVERG